MYDCYLSKKEMAQYKKRPLYDIPAVNQKSFYGKAKYIHYENGFVGCLSYNTVVCVYNPSTDEFYRTWDDWSKTTNNHINAFLDTYFLPRRNKKEWLAVPCYYFNWLYNF